MIRLITCLLLTVAVLVSICMHTKPGREAHMEKLSSSLFANMDGVLPEGMEIPAKVMEGMKSEGVVETMLDRMLVVDDYAACTVGRIVVGDNRYVVSVGVIGNVFALSQDGMAEMFVYRLREKGFID